MLGAAMGMAVDKAQLTAYWQFLSDLELPAFLRAVSDAGKGSKFFPRPAELRELAGAGPKADALIAWDAVRNAMRKCGRYVSVDFGPLVNAVVRSMGGWLALDDMETAQLDVWGKKEFERVYALLEPKDPATLSGGALDGEFKGIPIRVAIGGVLPPLQLADAGANQTSDVVRRLANAKAVG